MQVEEILALVGETWRFDPETYPMLSKLTSDEALAFAVAHTAKHMVHNADAVLKATEQADHGKPLDPEMLKEEAAKSLVNALALLNLLGMTENDVIFRLQAWAAENHPPRR